MTIKLSYFLAKKRCTLDKYVSKNRIKTYEGLRENLICLGVEVPHICSVAVQRVFYLESLHQKEAKLAQQPVHTESLNLTHEKEVIVVDKPKKVSTVKKSRGRPRTRRKKKG